MAITFGPISAPVTFSDVEPVFLTDDTLLQRKNALLAGMQRESFDWLVIYADKEHGSNFEYLTGFIPRFEEGLLLLNQSGDCTLVLGNENLKMARFSRTAAALLHTPYFSLPNQPMDNEAPLESLFKHAGLANGDKVGLVGWKMFTPAADNGRAMFDLPYFIVDAIQRTLSDDAMLENAIHLFIGDNGARTTCNANEIAHYEYGANLASNCMLEALNAIEVGVRETELGALLHAEGQCNTVVTIAATGSRFDKANLYPTYKKSAARRSALADHRLQGRALQPQRFCYCRAKRTAVSSARLSGSHRQTLFHCGGSVAGKYSLRHERRGAVSAYRAGVAARALRLASQSGTSGGG
jgi:Xaa-Pro aminopeptidase